MESIPIPVWVHFSLEVTTESGMAGKYWMSKLHTLPASSLVPGVELDYRTITGLTVVLEKILVHPETGEYQAIQESWHSIGAGELTLWEHSGWRRTERNEEEEKRLKRH